MGRETRQKVGGQGFRPAKGYLAHGGVARGLGLLSPIPVGVRIGRCGITEPNFGSSAEGVQVDHRTWSGGQEVRRKKQHQLAREPLAFCW